MDKNFTSGASSVTVQYSVTGNCQDKVSFTKDGDFISTSKTSTSITISVSENRGEERTGHVYTYYNNTLCDNNTITIRQAAGPCIPAQVSYQYDNYSGSVGTCDTSKTVTVSGVKTTTYRDPSCEQETEQVTTSVTLNFDKNTSSDERTIQSSFTINNSSFTVDLVQPGGCEESDKYLTIKSLCDDNKIYFKSTHSAITKTVSVSTDNSNTWTSYTSSSGGSGTLIATLNKNEKIWLKGSYTKYNNVSFVSSGEYELYGNIMSLVNYTSILDNNAFEGLFSQSSKLKKAENLVLPKTSASYCYHGMFSGCTSLETAPKLPATTLAFSCYEGMFEGCTSLRTAPDLPATTLATQCYMGMFSGCTSLTTAPDLPATELKNNCYRSMFYGCTSLTTAPSILSATTLASFCYYEMFRGCTSLTSAPELPATTLASQCYRDMFRGCTSLVNVPPIGTTATTMAESACTYMFSGCTSLTTAPELPATTLAGSCYNGMFAGCTSLVDAPGLPVTTLANYCYYEMFYNCTSLATAPNLPATTLANYCYSSMFRGCTSLTTAPGLPATTLASYCYGYMFYGCTKLNSITCLATDISATDCTYNWVSGVAESGTFTKAASMSSWATTGTSGIPSGWTVKDAQ